MTHVARPLKVAHLTTVDSSLWFLLRAQLLGARDAGMEVLGISAPGPWVATLEADGVRHVPLSTSTRGWSVVDDVRAAVELWRVLRREQVDVLHTHNPKPGLYGRVIGRVAGVPIVVNTNHGLYVRAHRPGRNAVVLLLEAVAARFSDAELLQNEEDLDLVSRRRVVPARKAQLLGNGVDVKRFRPPASATERAEARATLGAADADVVVGMVGRLVVEKGVRDLAAAAAILGASHHVVVIGPPDPEKTDALTVAELDEAASAGVRFLGERDDLDLLYRGMDVFVLPSYREGVPRAAIEAMASGVPVVATDIRGCRQVVDDGVTGVLVPVGDPTRLARAIRELGGDPAQLSSYGAAGVERARALFDERRVVATVLATYRELAARKMRRRQVAARA